MREKTEEINLDPNRCMDDQRKFLSWFQNTLDEFLALKTLVEALRSRQEKTDASVEALQKELQLVGPKYDTVLKILNEQNEELDASKKLRIRLTPLIDNIDDYMTKLKGWRVWWQRVGGLSFFWIMVTVFRPDLSPVVLAKLLEIFVKGSSGVP